MAATTVTAINKRAFRDFYFGWYDIINTGLFIALVTAALGWIIVRLILDAGALSPYLSVSDSDRFNGILVLFSVFISGGTATGIWFYQEIIERWASAQTVKRLADSLLTSLPVTDPGRTDHQLVPDTVFQGAEDFVGSNLKAVSMLAPANRARFIDLIARINAYNGAASLADQSDAAKALRLEALDQIRCDALIVVRQLERGNTDRFDALAASLEQHSKDLAPYYRFSSAQAEPVDKNAL